MAKTCRTCKAFNEDLDQRALCWCGFIGKGVQALDKDWNEPKTLQYRIKEPDEFYCAYYEKA
jgi:hypothetical protein